MILVEPGGIFPRDADYIVYLTPIGEDSPLAMGRMDVKRAEELLSAGLVSEELASYVENCLIVLRSGAEESAVLDSGSEHALLLYMLDQHTPGMMITP